VTAHRNDIGTFRWGQRPQPWLVSAVNLNASFPSQAIVFRIERFGAIVGTVRDAAGEPMPNVQVLAARRSWGNGKAAMQMAGSATTDDRGVFRLSGLVRGRYGVCVTAPQGGVPALPVGYAAFDTTSRKVYAGSCPLDVHSRGLVEIARGKQVEMDLELSTQEPVTVSGRVTNPPEGQNVAVQIQSVEQGSTVRTVFAQAAGESHTFRFENILPGRYWLSTWASGNDNGAQIPLAARVPLTVGDAGVTEVELTLAPLPAVGVAIHAPPGAGAISVGLRDADEPFGVATEAQRQADGSLRIALEHSGRYWLVVRTPLCPTAAHLGKADALNHAVDIVPGMKEPLEVTISNQCGDIQATVIDQTGKPVPLARLLLLMSGTTEEAGDLDLSTAGEDGSMPYSGLTPGKYALWAWTEADEWNGTVDDLAALEDTKTTVEVRAGEKASVHVPLLSTFRRGDK